MEIHEKCPEEYTTLIMRRFMMRIAERIARKTESEALITGESIGQVASQTMECPWRNGQRGKHARVPSADRLG